MGSNPVGCGGGGGAACDANTSIWSRLENKTFEQALAQSMDPSFLLIHPPPSSSSSDPAKPSPPPNWSHLCSLLPHKSISQIKHHYHLLLHDIASIEADHILPPHYSDPFLTHHPPSASPLPVPKSAAASPLDHHPYPAAAPPPFSGSIRVHPPSIIADNWAQQRSPPGHAQQRTLTAIAKSVASPVAAAAGHGRGSKVNQNTDQERKKGIPWTEEEHRLFLLGLDKFGKGDWRSISRNFVVSRTPTQVASHAQKYFIRLNSMNKEKRRSSIHDITSPTTPTINDHLTPLSPSMTIPSSPRPQVPSLGGVSSPRSSHHSQLVTTNRTNSVQIVPSSPLTPSNTPSSFIPSPTNVLPFNTPHSNSLLHQHNL